MVEWVSLGHVRFKEIDGRLADRLKVGRASIPRSNRIGRDIWAELGGTHGPCGAENLKSKTSNQNCRWRAKPSNTPTRAPQNLHLPIDVKVKASCAWTSAFGRLVGRWLTSKYFSLRGDDSQAHAQNGQYHVQATAQNDWGNRCTEDGDGKPAALDVIGNYSGQTYQNSGCNGGFAFTGTCLSNRKTLASASAKCVTESNVEPAAGVNKSKEPLDPRVTKRLWEMWSCICRTCAEHPVRFDQSLED